MPRPHRASSPPAGDPPERAPVVALPTLDGLIGRDQELDDLLGDLGRTPLLTITGPPGVGKSRLALEAVGQLRAGGMADAVVVNADRLSRSGHVASAVERAVKAHRSGAARLGLDAGAVIVVLDNCDHLLEACAEAAGALVGGGDRVMATAREPLGVEGEWIRRVAPLPAPGSGQDLPDLFTEFETVQLVCVRAASVRRGFIPTPESAQAIAEICNRLDGIPLAIELAAGALTAYSLPAIVRGLDDPFALLASGPRGAHPRHRDLRSSLGWSYDLLSSGQRDLLRRLGVFLGSFTEEAAGDVAGGRGRDKKAVSILLRSLVEKSLVEVDIHRDPTRYRLLGVQRRFAVEQFKLAGELDAVRDRHARWCVASVSGPERVEPHHDDIRAALAWAVERQWGEGARVLADADLRVSRAEMTSRRGERATEGWATLTEAQRKVAKMAAEGLTNGEIASALGISLSTVKTHLEAVFRKLEVSNRASLAVMAIRETDR